MTRACRLGVLSPGDDVVITTKWYGGVTVCWARDEASARKTAHRIWPTAAMESSLAWELSLPKRFEDVAKLVTEDAVAESVVCGPDPERYVEAIGEYVKAGFDHVSVHQVGPDQEGFFQFFARDVTAGRAGRAEPPP